eukprot:1160579-Pelagomonas_calceolata.AAC.2
MSTLLQRMHYSCALLLCKFVPKSPLDSKNTSKANSLPYIPVCEELQILRCMPRQDGTMVTTKSGAEFPRDGNDWRFINKDVPQKMKQYSDEGYRIAIFRVLCSDQKAHSLIWKSFPMPLMLPQTQMSVCCKQTTELRRNCIPHADP